ncbi:MAG: hypothetical protein NVS2B16_23430 [Chloroflexota bacterium]
MRLGTVQAGDVIIVMALKADGQPYRRWKTVVESSGDDHIVTVSRIGDAVSGPCGGWRQRHDVRTFFWFERPYNLLEVYEDDGRLKQIYVNIASVPVLKDRTLIYTDYELDVVRRQGRPIRVVDEDEFIQAAQQFGYSHEFQKSCRRAVAEALHLVSRWRPLGPPAQTQKDVVHRARQPS